MEGEWNLTCIKSCSKKPSQKELTSPKLESCSSSLLHWKYVTSNNPKWVWTFCVFTHSRGKAYRLNTLLLWGAQLICLSSEAAAVCHHEIWSLGYFYCDTCVFHCKNRPENYLYRVILTSYQCVTTVLMSVSVEHGTTWGEHSKQVRGSFFFPVHSFSFIAFLCLLHSHYFLLIINKCSSSHQL